MPLPNLFAFLGGRHLECNVRLMGSDFLALLAAHGDRLLSFEVRQRLDDAHRPIGCWRVRMTATPEGGQIWGVAAEGHSPLEAVHQATRLMERHFRAFPAGAEDSTPTTR